MDSLLLGGLVVAGLLAVTAPPAAASPDIRIYSASSAQDSETAKTAFAACRLPGEKVLGGGGRVIAGGDGVALQLMFPHPSHGYTVTAIEREDGFSGSWYVISYVVCGTAVTGWEFRESGTTTLPTGARTKLATVRCSAGKVVLGTGGVVGDVDRGVSFSMVFPTVDEVTVAGTEDSTDAFGIPNFGVGAFAICGDRPLGHEIVSDTLRHTSSVSHGYSVHCPAGKEITGVGMFKGGDNGAAHTTSMWPQARGEDDSVDDGFAGTRLWNTATVRTWTISAYAICVT